MLTFDRSLIKVKANKRFFYFYKIKSELSNQQTGLTFMLSL